jgi:hypothetical protein
MSKRFTDTEKWKKPFIRNLSAPYKLLWLYICDDCDHAGIWQVDIDVARIRIGEDINEQDAVKFFGDKLVRIDKGNKWYIPSFIDFQYPSGLNPDNKAHGGIIKILQKHNLIDDEFKPLISPLYGAMDMDKEMDMDKDKVMVKKKLAENTNSKCTFEQVYEYMAIRIGTDQAKIEAEKFVNYYTSNGWKVGKNPMKSWGAAANNWITNSKQYAKGTTNNQRKLDKHELENLKNYNFIYSTSYGAGDYDRIFGGESPESKLYHI